MLLEFQGSHPFLPASLPKETMSLTEVDILVGKNAIGAQPGPGGSPTSSHLNVQEGALLGPRRPGRVRPSRVLHQLLRSPFPEMTSYTAPSPPLPSAKVQRSPRIYPRSWDSPPNSVLGDPSPCLANFQEGSGIPLSLSSGTAGGELRSTSRRTGVSGGAPPSIAPHPGSEKKA